MGELLSFPARPDPGSGTRGAGRAPAPLVVPGDDARAAPERSGASAADAPEGGARWAVPGVDDHAAPPPTAAATRASRRAENVALAALTRHDTTAGEIRAKLLAKGLEPDDVEHELERLTRSGLIDDAAFATRQLERLRERKGMGDSAIRSALRGRLVPQDVVDAVMAEQVEDEETAEQRLQEVADDRARRLGSLPHDVAERRLIAYLMRKGFSGSAARAAARTALDRLD